jgi:DNA-binding transcriptional LysR family regulator
MNHFDWELLPFFLAVARAGSLRAAAEITNTSYGTVNRNIQALETSYGVRLFHRSKRGFALTDFGEALMPAAEAAEQAIAAARRKVEGVDRSESGLVRFSVTPTLAYDIVAPILVKFQKRYPKIDVQLQVTSEIESIPKSETDISLRAAMDVKDDVVARKLFQLQLGVYASKTYLDAHLPTAGDHGEGLDWIGLSQGNSPPEPYQKATLRHRIDDGYMRTKLVTQGCGISVMPTLLANTQPQLALVPGSSLTRGPWLWILLHSDLRRTVRVRRLVDFVVGEMRKIRD